MKNSSHQSAGELLALWNESESQVDIEITIEELFGNQKHSSSNKNEFVIHQNGVNVVDSSGSYQGETRSFDPDRLKNEDAFQYNMKHQERGCFIIFNQEKFDPHLEMESREGTNKDAHNMFLTATAMGFEYIKIFHNRSRNEILEWIHAVSKADHSSYDSFGFAILTHGDDGDVLYARDDKLDLNECTNPFCAEECPSLAGKPKFFFIQACRGTNLDHGFRINTRFMQRDEVDGPGMVQNTTIPNQADFLIARSTTPGYLAWRNKANGSWFVQALHYCIHKYCRNMEIMQIMTRVNNMVAYDFASSTKDGTDGFKQIPSISSRLTAEVYFHKTKEETLQCPTCALAAKTLETNGHSTQMSTQPAADSVEEFTKPRKSKSFRKWLGRSLRRRAK